MIWYCQKLYFSPNFLVFPPLIFFPINKRVPSFNFPFLPGLIDTSWPAIKIGVYAKHLQRWLQFFPLSQFHFVDGENLIRNPGEEMIKVQDFLGQYLTGDNV